MSKVHLSTYNQNGYEEYRIPGIVCTENNTLLAYCEARSGMTDWGKIEIIVWRGEAAPTAEDPTARNWSEFKVLVPSPEGDTVNNANMMVDGDRIHFIYHINYRKVFYMRSTDDGITWTEPKEITSSYDQFRDRKDWTVCASGPSHGIKLKNGRLILPIWVGRNEWDPQAHCPQFPGVVYSDDRGDTWKAGGLIVDDELCNAGETVSAELSDGSLMINMRCENDLGVRAVAISKDNGESFGKFFYDEQLSDPQCSAGMTAHDGKIYFSNCANKPMEGDSRINLTIKVSEDDGKTWNEYAKVEDRAGYSDLAIDKNNNLYCFYECERPEGVELRGSFPQAHLTVFGMELK